MISSLQLNAHNSFAVCKGKESLYAPLLCLSYLRKIGIKFVVKHIDCLFCLCVAGPQSIQLSIIPDFMALNVETFEGRTAVSRASM